MSHQLPAAAPGDVKAARAREAKVASLRDGILDLDESVAAELIAEGAELELEGNTAKEAAEMVCGMKSRVLHGRSQLRAARSWTSRPGGCRRGTPARDRQERRAHLTLRR